MYEHPRFSNNTSRYLDCFHAILEGMIQGMTDAELTDSISHNFIVQMIPHHQAAIEMSRNILQYTTYVPLQDIASRIITEQTKSIANMRAVLPCCSRLKSTDQALCRYQNNFHQITQTMFTDMQDACTSNNLDATFMRQMIPHHKGAVRMSHNALNAGVCKELIPILQAIISSQCEGIKQMECLLRRI